MSVPTSPVRAASLASAEAPFVASKHCNISNGGTPADTTLWTPEEIAAYYGAYAATYDAEIDSDRESYPAPFVIGQWVLDHLANSLGNQQPRTSAATPLMAKILDVGCGTGQSSVIFFKHQQLPNRQFDVEVHGIDTTPEMLDRARARPFTSLELGNVEKPLPYAKGQFAAAVCVGVFDFISDPCDLLRDIHSVTDATAVLGLTMPENGELNGWTLDQMHAILESAGWRPLLHERLLGYRDSKSGEVTWYHSFLVAKAHGAEGVLTSSTP